MRIAIDISIWQFQIQSGKGGSNPALRTLYYRLIRLLALNVQPLFIFDGPHKPPFKRNVQTRKHAPCLVDFMAKQLLDRFGFPYYTAPGEAEAECAALQQRGMVDAVLSEDVDTLMFGCGISLRNWSSEGTRASKSPTHINVYDAKKLRKSKTGLDREGMILVALMSGGDYLPAGIPGCGIKIACQAAKAGFGLELCKLSKDDSMGFRQWRERLEYELHTNESGYFRVKHKALKVPQAFPDRDVLGYYTHPVVSSPEQLSSLEKSIRWNQEMDVVGLRQYVGEAFEWKTLAGAKKFIRGLAPALLIHRLRVRGESGSSTGSVNLDRISEQEAQLIQVICDRRQHFISDGTAEMRVAYIPASIVGLDLDAEEAEYVTEDIAKVSADSENELRSRSASPVKPRASSQYDPTQTEKIWVPETFLKIGVPLTVETWEEEMRNPKKFASRKARAKKIVPKGAMKKGALDPFVRVTKPSVDRPVRKSPRLAETHLSPAFRIPDTHRARKSPSKPAAQIAKVSMELSERHEQGATSRPTTITDTEPITRLTEASPVTPVRSTTDINPWTLSRRPSDTFGVSLPKGVRYSALGIFGSPTSPSVAEEFIEGSVTVNLRGDCGSPSPSTPTREKHKALHPPTAEPNWMKHVDNTEPPAQRHTQGHISGARPPSHLIINLVSPPTTKKRTSPSTTANLPDLKQLNAQTTTQRGLRLPDNLNLDAHHDDTNNNTIPKPPHNQNHKSQNDKRQNDITTPSKAPPSSPSLSSPPPSSLPSPSTLLPPASTNPTPHQPPPPPQPAPLSSSISAPALPPPGRSTRLTHHPRLTRTIALRESLAGTWKEVDEREARVRKTVYQGVELLDLCGT